MDHHGVIAVWALVWCLWVFLYSMWYSLDWWINEHVVRDDNDDNNDTYLIQFWLGEDFNETNEDASYSFNLD